MIIDGTPTPEERSIIEEWSLDNPDIVSVAVEPTMLTASMTAGTEGVTARIKRTGSLLADLATAAASVRSK